jgi:hypothetical protein
MFFFFAINAFVLSNDVRGERNLFSKVAEKWAGPKIPWGGQT